MTAAALVEPPRLHLELAPASPSDLAYVRSSWHGGWRTSERCRRLSPSQYDAYFDRMVRDGVLKLPALQVLVGYNREDTWRLWCWIAYEPGIEATADAPAAPPAIHYAVVRPRTEQGVELRRLGLFARMVGAIGVRDRVTYTFRPPSRGRFGNALGIEAGMLAAAARQGIAATFVPVEEYLAGKERA